MKKLNILVLILYVVSIFASSVSADTLQDKSKELQEIRKKIEQEQKALNSIRDRKLTLKNQLSILDQQIKLGELQLQAINNQIDKTGSDMTRINSELVAAEINMYESKKILREAIKEAYLRRRVGLLEVMVGSNSLSSFMSQMEYISTIEGRITNSISLLQDLNDKLKAKKGELENAYIELQQLQSSQQLEQNSLNVQEDSKNRLLTDATLTEAEYQKRLEASIADQRKLEAEIARLANSSGRAALTSGKLLWPIPSRRVTAGFRDGDYLSRFKIPHNAIDVSTPHGTPIKAPADAYVLKVKFDGSTAYSYIMLDHGGKLVTVYGHVSSVRVSTGQFVPAGTVIGTTGATPGSVGAGFLTTGPHLHFEVWENGAARNPLSYLVG